MSVDVDARFGRPVTLGAVLEETHRVLGELLQGGVPELVMYEERRRLTGPELKEIMVGQPIPDEGAVFFRVEVPVFEDGAQIMVSDFGDDADEIYGGRHASISPYRTSVGVVVATGVALGVARVSGGRFIDEQFQRFPPALGDPGMVIARSRLASGEGDFDVRCERYLRQFSGFRTWPEDRSGLAWRLASGG